MLIKHIILILLMLNSCIPIISTGIMSLGISSAKDKTIGESIDDTAILNKIRAEFIKKGFKNLYAKINIQVYQGRVLYTGYVDNDQDIITAIDIAWNQKEIKEVINELLVSEDVQKSDPTQYAKDLWITTRIKSKIFTQRDIKFINYTIITIKNVVYLFGLARSEEELDKVSKIAACIAGVEKVISHVIIKNN